jgi:hypothetical protein
MGDDLITAAGNGIQKYWGARGAPIVSDEQVEADSPINETREEKFVRLALARMPNVKRQIRLVANLASYPHTEAQRDKIMSELRKMVADVDAAFSPKTRDDNFRF